MEAIRHIKTPLNFLLSVRESKLSLFSESCVCIVRVHGPFHVNAKIFDHAALRVEKQLCHSTHNTVTTASRPDTTIPTDQFHRPPCSRPP